MKMSDLCDIFAKEIQAMARIWKYQDPRVLIPNLQPCKGRVPRVVGCDSLEARWTNGHQNLKERGSNQYWRH